MGGAPAFAGGRLATPAGGRDTLHVLPLSRVRSKCTRHVLGVCGVSVLLGAIMVPSASRTGLFLIGPRIPSGSCRAPLHVRPSSPDVPQNAPPFARIRADFIKERQLSLSQLEQNRIPCREPPVINYARRDFDGSGPLSPDAARQPDTHVGRALARAAKPGRRQPLARLDDRGRVRAGERGGLENEFSHFRLHCLPGNLRRKKCEAKTQEERQLHHLTSTGRFLRDCSISTLSSNAR